MKLIDTHCHIQDIGHHDKTNNTTKLWLKLNKTIDQVIEEAKKQGVFELIVVGCNLDESIWAVEMANKYPNVFSSIGIHPHEADKYVDRKDWIDKFQLLIKNPKVVAIGECGLDFHYNYSQQSNQLTILKEQIKLAKTSDKPIIFHVREAFDKFWEVLDKYNLEHQLRGLLHSFVGSQHDLEVALRNNLYIGINGIATFCRDNSLLDIYKKVPNRAIVLETDSPYLTPVPFRGMINTPKNVKQIARFLAELRGQKVEHLAQFSTENSQKLFAI